MYTLQAAEGRQWLAKKDKLDVYNLNNAVSVIQHMVWRERLLLVGLSAVPASTPPHIPPFEYELNLAGQRRTVQCEYHNILLHEVLKPADPETLIEAKALDDLN